MKIRLKFVFVNPIGVSFYVVPFSQFQSWNGLREYQTNLGGLRTSRAFDTPSSHSNSNFNSIKSSFAHLLTLKVGQFVVRNKSPYVQF